MEFNSKKIGIWGFGVVGNAALRFFHAHKAEIYVMDARQPNEEQVKLLNDCNAHFIPQERMHDFFEIVDAVLPSPGINRSAFDLPTNIQWLNELDIFHHFWRKPIIAITGSAGKTSVTTMLGSCLQAAGKRVALGGNIGVGMLDLLSIQDNSDYAVLELSSFQLELCKTFAPDLALWTNFSDNHLDRHATKDAYFQAKFGIMAHQRSDQKAIVPIDLAPYLMHGTYQGNLIWHSDALRTQVEPLYHQHHGAIMYANQNTSETLYDVNTLPQSSFVNNWIIVIAALHQLGVTIPQLSSCAIKLPEHRLEHVISIKGAHFYNDSKSTTTLSTCAAVSKFPSEPIVLFVGGISKGVDRTDAIKELSERVRLIYCFGAESVALHNASTGCPALAFDTLDQAFAHYMNNMRKPHDIVLFSPSGASFDLYANYQERGTHFKKLVAQYSSKQ